MASTNQSPFYQRAEARFQGAKSDEDRLEALEEMIRECPKHKSSENMLANLKTRQIKLKAKIEKSAKSKKSSGKKGIKKEDMQAIIIGKTNSGKSSLIQTLTQARPEIANYNFTTKFPILGAMRHKDIQVQIIENPAIGSEYYDKGLANNTDTLVLLITDINEINELEESLKKAQGKRIIAFNKIDKLNENEKRKLHAQLQSKKFSFVLISTKTKENFQELKEMIFKSFDKIRVYTKKPEKKEREPTPVIMKPNATVKDVAEKILHGLSRQIKETKIWGPSSKFSGQKVGLQHKLKDKDVVEFKTK